MLFTMFLLIGIGLFVYNLLPWLRPFSTWVLILIFIVSLLPPIRWAVKFSLNVCRIPIPEVRLPRSVSFYSKFAILSVVLPFLYVIVPICAMLLFVGMVSNRIVMVVNGSRMPSSGRNISDEEDSKRHRLI